MQSSRQKKRASQQKKRYHGRADVKAEKLEARSSETGKASTSPYAEKKAALPTVSRNIARDQPSERRSVLTEDRNEYLEASAQLQNPMGLATQEHVGVAQMMAEDLQEQETRKEEEEWRQQRLQQLLSMPIQHDHTLPTQEEAPITIQVATSTTPTRDPSISSFLTLDCIALAESLSTLPLHEKLDLDFDLLRLGDLPPLPPYDVTTPTSQSLPTNIDLSVCSKTSKLAERFSSDRRAAAVSVGGDKGGSGSGLNREAARKVSSQVMGKAAGEDEVLDKLLERHSSVGTGSLSEHSVTSRITSVPEAHRMSLGVAGTTSSHDNQNLGSTTAPGYQESASGETKNISSPKTENMEELDEMLDELLL